MDAYIVIGNPNTRKASLLRALTGCFNRSLRDIELASGKTVLRLYARVGALQDTRTTAADFAQEVARQRCDAVLCCLAPGASLSDPQQHPGAAAYLDQFLALGWRVQAIAVLGQNAGGVRSPRLAPFPQAGTAPINVTAQAVRRHFGWL